VIPVHGIFPSVDAGGGNAAEVQGIRQDDTKSMTAHRCRFGRLNRLNRPDILSGVIAAAARIIPSNRSIQLKHVV